MSSPDLKTSDIILDSLRGLFMGGLVGVYMTPIPVKSEIDQLLES